MWKTQLQFIWKLSFLSPLFSWFPAGNPATWRRQPVAFHFISQGLQSTGRNRNNRRQRNHREAMLFSSRWGFRSKRFLTRRGATPKAEWPVTAAVAQVLVTFTGFTSPLCSEREGVTLLIFFVLSLIIYLLLAPYIIIGVECASRFPVPWTAVSPFSLTRCF